MLPWLILLLFGPIIATVQNGLIANFNYPLNQFNLILCALLFLLFTTDNIATTLALTFWTVWLVELSAATPFGFYIFSYLLTIFFAAWLCRNVFTNRSLWALLALGAISAIFLRLSWWLINLLFSIKFALPAISFGDYWISLLPEIIFNDLMLLLWLILAQRFTRKMRGLFLTKN